MKVKLLFIIVLITILSSCKKPSGHLTGNIYWKHNDNIDNKPDASSKVKLYSTLNKDCEFETTADIAGKFTIKDIPTGNYFLIVQSENTTTHPIDHLNNLLKNANEINIALGFDINKFKKEIQEINKLQKIYEAILMEVNSNDYKSLSNQVYRSRKIQNEIESKSINLIKGFPKEFKSNLAFYTGYDKSLNFSSVEIKEGKTANKNIDFGTTYN
ncbi:hypothetical protein QWY99_11250 [Flavobacterium branchiarum]|uniref:Carboxypeptidase regulatory-like domain-containing protein n=1 Tax=Flavobacterium branchiarum TaxID=1114870 RepID=A0ABV5FGP9_9FLAO|nr:hypothetical protein [Flavobacterium branchiarum]MDN3673631.1 hypothetical protein [Flavobacterium branchiarum]